MSAEQVRALHAMDLQARRKFDRRTRIIGVLNRIIAVLATVAGIAAAFAILVALAFGVTLAVLLGLRAAEWVMP